MSEFADGIYEFSQRLEQEERGRQRKEFDAMIKRSDENAEYKRREDAEHLKIVQARIAESTRRGERNLNRG